MPTSPDTILTASPQPVAVPAPPLWRDYLELTKPEISFLVVISALAGFLLGSPDVLDGWQLFFTLIGVALTAGGACVLNHYFEREIDGAMKRTAGRPLPTGRIPARHAFYFGIGLLSAGVAIICPLVNPLTALLAILTAVFYLVVYTPLKRKTKYNTAVGTIPGALPALGGWTAATGSLGWGGVAIFAVLALWQMPHFLSLAWMYRKDYGRADYAMLPVVEPDGRSTAQQTLFCTAAPPCRQPPPNGARRGGPGLPPERRRPGSVVSHSGVALLPRAHQRQRAPRAQGVDLLRAAARPRYLLRLARLEEIYLEAGRRHPSKG